jgi:hypothetical protein
MAKQRAPRHKMTRIELELRDIMSSTVQDFDAWSPTPEETLFPVEMSIGERGTKGADIFQCLIATPEGLRKFRNKKFVIENRALIVVGSYVWPEILKELESIISGIKAVDWLDASQKLQRYFEWECEDMEWNEPF